MQDGVMVRLRRCGRLRHRSAEAFSADWLGMLAGMALLCHGMFFLREWLVIGLGVATGTMVLWRRLYNRRWLGDGRETGEAGGIGKTEKAEEAGENGRHEKAGRAGMVGLLWLGPFLGMALLSLLGLLRPVVPYLAWFEAGRWMLYACLFWWSRELARLGQWPRLRAWLLGWGVFFVACGFMPGLERFWSQAITEVVRLGSWIGYPNAAGAVAGGMFFLALHWGCSVWDGDAMDGGVMDRRSMWGQVRRVAGIVFVPAVFSVAVLASGSRGAVVCWLFALLLWMGMGRGRVGEGQAFMRGRWIALIMLPLAFCGVLLLGLWGGVGGEAWLRLGVWDMEGVAERGLYVRDALRLAELNAFWPGAGAWHAYPLVSDEGYVSSDPHSSFLWVLLHQGAAGAALVLLWGGSRLGLFFSRRGKRMRMMAQNRALVAGLCFLALHSGMDADLAFGCWGFLFWVFMGIASFASRSE